MGVVDAAHDRRDFLCGLLATDTGLQPSNHHEPVVVDLGHLLRRSLVVHRKEDLHLLLGKSKPTWHHANDGVRFRIQIDFAADDGRVTAKAAFPKRPTEDDGTVGGRLVVLRREGASDAGLDTERGEKVPGTDRCTDLFGQRTSFGEVVLRPVLIKREIGERSALAFPFAVNAGGDDVRRKSVAAFVEPNELLRVIERQRLQENRPDDGEQRDSRAHANGNHQHRHR